MGADLGIVATLTFIIPELMLAIGAMALLTIGVFMGEESGKVISLSAIALLIATALVVAVSANEEPQLLFDGAFRIDAFSNFCKLIILGGGAFAILMSDRFLGGEELGRFEYPILIVLAALGMAMMVSANDLIALYMGVETQSLALYILAAFNRDSHRQRKPD